MTVDELLVKSILTPVFICRPVFMPKANSLQMLENEKGTFIYAQCTPPYHQTGHFDLAGYMKAAELKQVSYRTDNIKYLYQYLQLAEAGFKDGQLSIPPDLIQQLCYIYGFPIFEFLETQEKGLLIGFYTKDFLRRLNDLYTCFALWKALYIEDYELIRKIQPKLPAKEYQETLEIKLGAAVRIEIAHQDGQPQLIYTAASLMELVKAQLAVLASKGINYLEGGHIAYCANCGQPFLKMRKNRTMCDECQSGAVKQKRHRTKMKGVKSNG